MLHILKASEHFKKTNSGNPAAIELLHSKVESLSVRKKQNENSENKITCYNLNINP